MSRKRICVIGLGQFGSELAVRLAEVFDVLAIDYRQGIVDRLADRVQRAYCLDARQAHALGTVVDGEFDEAVVCLGESLEASILAVLFLKRIGIKSVRAKAKNDDHAEILRAIGVDQIIFPERETAHRLVQQIMTPNLMDFIPISDEYSVMELTAPEFTWGHSLGELDLRKKYNLFVVALKDSSGAQAKFLPQAGQIVEEGHILVTLATQESLKALNDAGGQELAEEEIEEVE